MTVVDSCKLFYYLFIYFYFNNLIYRGLCYTRALTLSEQRHETSSKVQEARVRSEAGMYRRQHETFMLTRYSLTMISCWGRTLLYMDIRVDKD